jgi:hypothetical protein
VKVSDNHVIVAISRKVARSVELHRANVFVSTAEHANDSPVFIHFAYAVVFRSCISSPSVQMTDNVGVMGGLHGVMSPHVSRQFNVIQLATFIAVEK